MLLRYRCHRSSLAQPLNQMKFSLCHLVALLLIAMISLTNAKLEAQNFSFLEIETLSNFDRATYVQPQINLYTSAFKGEKRVGTYFFSLLNAHWGQAYGGIVVKATDWLSVSVGAGMETDKNPYRLNLSLFAVKNKWKLMQIYEYGGSGFWYNIMLNHQLTEKHSVGMIFKRYYGLGLSYAYAFKAVPVSVLGSVMYDYEDGNRKCLLTVRYVL